MKIIGVTGPIGTGKSYIAKKIENRGFPRIDTDEVYHDLVSAPSECTKALEKEYGRSIIKESGELDRIELGKIVFSDKSKLLKLNEITHKYVIEETENRVHRLSLQGHKAVIVEVPLMFESGFNKKCDEIVCVVAERAKRIERICKRNGISEKEAEKRINNQKDIDFYIANSTFIVYNNDYEDLDAQIDALLTKVLG